MKIVKLSFHYDWPLFRQTPNFSGEWGDYKFIIDDNLKECDFWVIYSDYKLSEENVYCSPENTIYLSGECYNTCPDYSSEFLQQFGLLITVQRNQKHPNILFSHNALPWFIGKSYDELIHLETPTKTKLISIISSNKIFTEGHRKRLEFVEKIKNYFGDRIDVFGRGINDFDDKWDVLSQYKYSIAIENDNCEDYVSEKFFDCLYSHTLPFYYGCPNLEHIVDKDSFIRIDINNIEESIKIIEKSIENDEFERRLSILQKESKISLNRDSFFPFITNVLDGMNSKAPKQQITIKSDELFLVKKSDKKNIFEKIINKLLNKLS